jgi:hypothetical protein
LADPTQPLLTGDGLPLQAVLVRAQRRKATRSSRARRRAAD